MLMILRLCQYKLVPLIVKAEVLIKGLLSVYLKTEINTCIYGAKMNIYHD